MDGDSMRFWIIPIIAIISVMAFVLFSLAYFALDYFEDQEPKSKVFADLTCEEIRKLNIAGLKIPENDTTFSQDRIFECIKEIADELKYQDYIKSSKYCTDRGGVWANDQCYDMYKNSDTTITNEKSEPIQLKPEQLDLVQLELEQLEQMNCDEMIQDVYDKRNGYKSKENRSYARDRTGDCNDKQEHPIRNGYCSTILISAKTPQNFFTDDPKADLINRIHDCVEDNEFPLNEVLLEHQIAFCDLYKEEELTACKSVQITSQPFSPTIGIDELYPILVENERKIINDIDCSELKKTYDGKIQNISWDVHRDMIVDALNDCKNK